MAEFLSDGEIIDLYENIEATLLNNLQLGQEDKKELDNYLKYTKRIHRFTEKGYFNFGLDTLREIIKYHGPFKALRGFDYFSTMQQAINRYISNPKLRDMLGYFIKYVGSSSMMHLQFSQCYFICKTRIMVCQRWNS